MGKAYFLAELHSRLINCIVKDYFIKVLSYFVNFLRSSKDNLTKRQINAAVGDRLLDWNTV